MTPQRPTLILLSDLHLGASSATFRRCASVVSNVVEKYDPKETLVAVVGDIAEHGKESEFRLARTVLEGLTDKGFAVIAGPGNHDYGPLGNSYLPDSQQTFERVILGDVCDLKPKYPLTRVFKGHRFFMLDSCYAPPLKGESLWDRTKQLFAPAKRFANGEIGEGQLAALAAWLEDDYMPVHVLLHHHPLWAAAGLRLVDADAFWDVLKKSRADVRGVYFGHRHQEAYYGGDKNPAKVPRVVSCGSTGHQGFFKAYTL